MIDNKFRQPKRNRAVWAIHAACTLFAILTIASLIFVLNRSVVEADRFGLSAERRLVANELRHQMDAAVQFQAQVSFWDATYAELAAGRPSDVFVAQELSGWLWEDYGFSWLIFSDADGHISTAVKDGLVVSSDVAGAPLHDVEDLVEEARRRYDNVLRNQGDTYTLSIPRPDRQSATPIVPNIHAVDLREIDGQMSIAIVQAVIPETLQLPAARRKPVFMTSVRPLTARSLRDIEAKLGVTGLSFVPLSDTPADSVHVPAGRCADASCIVVAWTPKSPGGFVRAEILPSVIAIAAAVTSLMAFVAFRFATLFAALQQSEARNRHMAKHDRLTGLLNRSGFDDALAAALLDVDNRPFALAFIDLDEFKAVNDEQGHAAGDSVLVAIAQRYRRRVGSKGTVARLGGDEFGVILRTGDAEADATALAAGLVIDAQTPIELAGQLLRVGGSVGVAFAPKHGRTARALLSAADEALYLAKRRGRNRVQTADDLTPEERIAADEEIARRHAG